MSLTYKHKVEKADYTSVNSAIHNCDNLLSAIEKRGGPKLYRQGLCIFITHGDLANSVIVRYLMKEAFKSWKHYSGSVHFPVPAVDVTDKCMEKVHGLQWRSYGTDGHRAHVQMATSSNHYKGKYGELRIDLLKHVRQELMEFYEDKL